MLVNMVNTVPSDHSSGPSRIRRSIATRGVRASFFVGAHKALRSLESAVTRAEHTPPPSRFIQLIDVADPVEAVYRAGFRTAVISVPLQSVRWSRVGLRLDDDRNPFVALVRAHLSGEATGYPGSALQRHYDEWRPATIGDAWGLAHSDASPDSTTRQPRLPCRGTRGGVSRPE